MSVISGGSRSIRDVQTGNAAFKTTGWTSTGDSATLTELDNSGGGISLAHGTDNEGATIRYGGEIFDFGDVGCRCVVRGRFKYTVASANGGGFYLGFTDTATSDVITDSDVMASQDAIGIFRATNSAFFRTTALNAAAESGETTTTALASGTEYAFRIEIEGLTAGLTIRFYVDNVLIDTVTGFAYASFGPELELAAAIKVNGTVANTLEIYQLEVSHRAMS